jgi:uncharacterized cupredoxin-like copper-binding protein
MNRSIRQWIVQIVLAVALIWTTDAFLRLPSSPALAALPLAKQIPIEVKIDLGTKAGDLQFVPNQFHLQAGKRYKLLLNNPSPLKHYFTAKDFADAIWSQKVDAGNVEVKGAIHELELRPGTSAEWVFVPIRSGLYSLRCTVAGHTEAGMTGTLEITG